MADIELPKNFILLALPNPTYLFNFFAQPVLSFSATHHLRIRYLCAQEHREGSQVDTYTYNLYVIHYVNKNSKVGFQVVILCTSYINYFQKCRAEVTFT